MGKAGWTWTVIAIAVLGAVGVSMYSGEGGWLKERLLALHGSHAAGAQRPRPIEESSTAARAATIPFELVRGHVVLSVTVDDSRPLSFLLDTGNKFAVIELACAKELGVKLGAAVQVKGVGPRETSGTFVESGMFKVSGLTGYAQPLSLAIPLGNIAARMGHDVDGILGADFVREFVLELDYPARVIRLHDKNTFAYSGAGESVAMRLDAQGHPTVEGEVTPVGGDPLRGRFMLDVGSDAALNLYGPFVTEHHLPGAKLKTIPGLGHAGTGGKASGRTGRVSAFKIGQYTLDHPIAFFAEDKAGAFASTEVQGSVGQEVLSRFKVYLDYAHQRVILEPSPSFAEAFDHAISGLFIEAEGKDYKRFRITEALEESPASEAGLRVGDMIADIDGKGSAEWTLTQLIDVLRRPVACKLTVRRGEQALVVSVTPKHLL
jgi:hypothetical protein